MQYVSEYVLRNDSSAAFNAVRFLRLNRINDRCRRRKTIRETTTTLIAIETLDDAERVAYNSIARGKSAYAVGHVERGRKINNNKTVVRVKVSC